jgi:hypothetical protein
MTISPKIAKLALTAFTALAASAAILGMAGTAHADAPVNLPVTDTVRSQLIEAGAAHKGLPVSDFVGLRPGLTYYAYDPETATYWAGARMAPSPDSWGANIADQDAGTYTLFQQHEGGPWKAYSDGVARDPGCPAPLPPTIIAMWGWDATWCRPVPGY